MYLRAVSIILNKMMCTGQKEFHKKKQPSILFSKREHIPCITDILTDQFGYRVDKNWTGKS